MRLSNFSRRRFVLLLAGVVTAIALIVAWAAVYKKVQPDFLSLNASVARTNAAIRLSQALDAKRARKALHELDGRGLHFKMLATSSNAVPIYYSMNSNLRDYLQTTSVFEVALLDGKWLQVKRGVFVVSNLLLLMYAMLCLVVVALFIFCYWIVGSLQFPVSDLNAAAKRFTRDMNAPPLAETGPDEYKAAIAAFNNMQSRLRKLIFDRTQMLTAISHDLQTPITRLQLRAESVKDSELKFKINNDLDDMSSMIDSILSFARDYRENESVQAFDLDALLSTICDEFCDSGKDVKYSSQHRLVVSGRMLALKRVFSNLIDNAIKYAGSVQVALDSGDDSVIVHLSDNGPGIPEQELNQVFQPFYRVDRSRSLQVSGSGLGLSVASDIVTAHGGEIRIKNREPSGLLVSVELPKDETN
jgi:signal transduction histidine kinase